MEKKKKKALRIIWNRRNLPYMKKNIVKRKMKIKVKYNHITHFRTKPSYWKKRFAFPLVINQSPILRVWSSQECLGAKSKQTRWAWLSTELWTHASHGWWCPQRGPQAPCPAQPGPGIYWDQTSNASVNTEKRTSLYFKSSLLKLWVGSSCPPCPGAQHLNQTPLLPHEPCEAAAILCLHTKGITTVSSEPSLDPASPMGVRAMILLLGIEKYTTWALVFIIIIF